MKTLLTSILISSLLVACASNDKTIVIMSKGEATVDLNAGTIQSKDGAGHEEKLIAVNKADISFKLNTPAGEATVQLKENGLYIINVKNDTIIGSYQQYSTAGQAQKVMSQEILLQKIDSLQLLSQGKNVSAANKNYFILPNQAAFITANPQAQVVGPYHQMRSAERIDGKDPEIYRFYSIKEIRETIMKLKALTIASK